MKADQSSVCYSLLLGTAPISPQVTSRGLAVRTSYYLRTRAASKPSNGSSRVPPNSACCSSRRYHRLSARERRPLCSQKRGRRPRRPSVTLEVAAVILLTGDGAAAERRWTPILRAAWHCSRSAGFPMRPPIFNQRYQNTISDKMAAQHQRCEHRLRSSPVTPLGHWRLRDRRAPRPKAVESTLQSNP